MGAVHEVDASGRQRRACPLRALHRTQVIRSDPGGEGVAHDHIETPLARPLEDRTSIAHTYLDLRGLRDREVLTHLLGQKMVNLNGHVPGLRVRRRPCAGERARRTAHMKRTKTILSAPQRGHDSVHVLHVLELQVGGVRRVNCGRFDLTEEERRTRPIPPDMRWAEIRVERDVA